MLLKRLHLTAGAAVCALLAANPLAALAAPPYPNNSAGQIQALTDIQAAAAAIQTATGAVTASPTANTLQDRLKVLNTALAGLQATLATAAKQDTSNTALAALLVSSGQIQDLIGEVQASPTSNTLQDRLKQLKASVDQLHADLTALGTSGLATETTLASVDTKLSSQATAARQDTGNTSLGSIDTKLSSQATAANQSTANGSLSSIDTKLSSQATAAKQDTGNTSLSSIDTKLSSQATAANQTSANTKLDTINSSIGALGSSGLATAAQLPASLGTKTSANSLSVTPASDPDDRSGSGTISAQDAGLSYAIGTGGQLIYTGTPTASSSVTLALNGRSAVAATVTGSWTGTITPLLSYDGGTTYVTGQAGGLGYSYPSIVTNGSFAISALSGTRTATHVRLVGTELTSGSASIAFTASAAPPGANGGGPAMASDGGGGWCGNSPSCPLSVSLIGVSSFASFKASDSALALAEGELGQARMLRNGAPVMVVGDPATGVPLDVTAPTPVTLGSAVTLAAAASGGTTTKSVISANNTTSIAVCTAACNLYGVSVTGISAATPAYVKTYNTVQGSTTCGGGTVVDRFLIPANSLGSGGIYVTGGALGASYGTALSICITAGITDGDTTAPAANTYLVTLYYHQ
jgi:hypothetical protein